MGRGQREDDHGGVYHPDFLGKVARKGDLVSRLNTLHKSLQSLSQDMSDRPSGLQSTAAQLVSEKMLKHQDKDVRLLAVCCIVDIFRVYAPEAPYGDNEMVTVFEVINNQIRSLSTYEITSATGSKVLYILTSLATVKSCVVPVIMAQAGVPGADDVMAGLFEALISSFRADHGDEGAPSALPACPRLRHLRPFPPHTLSTRTASAHMCNILQACIEECDDIDQDLLDILLSPLLPSAKAENPVAYKHVGTVLRRCAGCIQNSVSAFVNHVLVGTSIPGKTKSSELADHVYPLVFELHKISPGLLLRVLPNICSQLQAEEEEIRLKVRTPRRRLTRLVPTTFQLLLACFRP